MLKALRIGSLIVGFLSLLLLIGASTASLWVDHTGERQMIDAPGVLDHGVCCVEAEWHVEARIAGLFGFAGLAISMASFAIASLFGTATEKSAER